MAAGMIARRDFLVGGACVAAAGAAYGLKPRHEVKLLPAKENLTDLVPMELPGWTGLEVGDPLALNQEGTLSARLYNQTVTRLYRRAETGAQVMMLLAYGARQSDDLQLHRPEICYPAFGYTLIKNQPTQVPLADRTTVPARRLVVTAGRVPAAGRLAATRGALPQRLPRLGSGWRALPVQHLGGRRSQRLEDEQRVHRGLGLEHAGGSP